MHSTTCQHTVRRESGVRESGVRHHTFNVASGINYPNQPKSIPDSHLSDPLTYWWGVTLCPPELNDVALAEAVVIQMRLAAMREMRLNEEVSKPSLAEVLEFKGLTDGLLCRVYPA